MPPQELTAAVREGIAVTDTLEAHASAFLRAYTNDEPIFNSGNMVAAFCHSEGHPQPESLDISTPELQAIAVQTWADFASHYIAGVEGVWRLLHEGHFLPMISGLNAVGIDFPWHTRNTRSGLHPRPVDILQLPQNLIVAPSRLSADDRPTLVTPEELLMPLIDGMADQEVIEAAKDSLECFRYRLYRPSIVLLGKVAEGAWIELTMSVAAKVGDTKTADDVKAGHLQFRPIVRKCRDLMTRPDAVQLIKGTGVRDQDIEIALVWTDTVRLARNAIHFGVKPEIPNTHDKAAVMLIAAVTHLRTLYTARQAVTEAN